MSKFKAIMAMNKLGYIGLNGNLPWKSKDDLNHFKTMTGGCILLCGYRTARTLPNLDNRKLIIDERENLVDVENIDWCIGGAKTYEKYCHLFDELHISIINDTTIGDVKAPELFNLNKNCKIFLYEFDTDK